MALTYFISYVRSSTGGMHDHHDFENDYLKLEAPITADDIRAFEGDSRRLWTTSTRIRVLNFQLMQ